MKIQAPIKILHTADWHLGKKLLKVDFSEDISLFFKWLINCIEENQINVLLMSGDLFDQANPSQQALKQYYLFLKQLLPLKCKVIITGGNHDSPNVINAPKELLDILDIKVVGGAPENISELFVSVQSERAKVIIAAVPFLRDKDIRSALPGESYNDKIDQIREGIASYFKDINEHYNSNFKGLPFIVMAHLYAQGASISDSEREIQIGNQAGVEASVFGEEPDYVALGHIHRPQAVGKNHIRYSGSPIPLSFSEKDDQKEVVILELSGNEFKTTSIKIPQFRKLISIKGTIAEAQNIIENYQSTSVLCDLAELNIIEETENINLVRALEDLLVAEVKNGLQILKGKITFNNYVAGTSKILKPGEDVGNFTPVQLFEKRLQQDASIDDSTELINAFKEVLESLNNTE